MKVRLLGPLEVFDDHGHPVLVPGNRQRTLLAVLGLTPNRVVSADRLIDGLWPTALPREPVNALQIVVSKLRRVIGAEVLETRPPGYVLSVATDAVDVACFEALVEKGRAGLAGGDVDEALVCFSDALGLWRGDALAEFGAAPMAAAAAARLDDLRAAAIEDRFEVLLAAGGHAEVVAELDAAIAASPFRERLRGQLMLALYRCGRQVDALRTFRDTRRVLAEDLGLEPGADLRRLEQAILAHDASLDLRPAGPPAHAEPVATTTPTNVLPALASFVGRHDDIASVGELLERHRLVTLVGAGGCGKTRLAHEIASTRLASFPGGVWFAALDGVARGDAVLAAVAGAVGLSTADTAGQPTRAETGLVDRLRSLLADRTALLVLDNCEHVADEAARLAVDVLAAAPRLRVLATSREALRVPGESVWRVPPLLITDAVALFVERARGASGTADLGDGDERQIAELCKRVDGMPLAIELLAARISAFTVGQLDDRLQDRFRLLTSGARTALPRHQTLRAVTDWSYDLLFDEERTVFERLAVFAGGFSLTAAEEVCADHDLEATEVGELLGRLVDKSLVVADGSGRFRLLLTLAEYGRQRLDSRSDAQAVADRHTDHYARLADQSPIDWRTPGGRAQTWWLACLTTELENVRASLDRSVASGDGHAAQLLAGGMGWYWWHSGRAAEGHRWLEEALACRSPATPAVHARALAWAAFIALQVDDRGVASRHAVQAIELGQQIADHTSLGLAWLVRARVALTEGRADLAVTFLDRGQQADEAAGDRWHHGIAAMLRAIGAMLRERPDVAARESVFAIDDFRAVGDVCTLVPMLHEYSRTLESSGEIVAAEAAATEASELSETFGLHGWQSTINCRLGELALRRGDTEISADHYRSAINLAQRLALATTEAIARDGLELATSAMR